MLRMILILCAGFLIGCGSKRDQSSYSSDYPRAIQNQSRTTNNPPQTTDESDKPITRRVIAPSDPPAMFRPTVNLSIYHLRVPAGTLSTSEEFWKRIDERTVDVTTYDVLYKNGIRVGRAPLAELDSFLKLLDRTAMQTLPAVFAASGAKTIELPMKKGALDQVLYDFDLNNTLTVRSYEECDNIFCIEFSPAPRKPGDVRVSLCPMVRTLRKRLVATGDLDTAEVEFKSPEKYFQLNLRTDIPLDAFLILGPSPEAKSSMSLGHAFFMTGGATAQDEDVLLILPQAIKARPERTDVQANSTEEKKNGAR